MIEATHPEQIEVIRQHGPGDASPPETLQ